MPYERLFSGFTLKRFKLRNRIAVLPYGTAMVENGAPTAEDVAHYANIAKSGPGLVITGATVVHPSSAMRNRILTEGYNPRAMEHLKHKVDVLHSHGTVVFGQILHLGREWTVTDSDYPPMAPSPIRSPRDAYVPREMTQDDIDEMVEAFGQTARNLQLAGYDGTEIHAAHGYLVAQFLSPATNRRTDAYGGSSEKRLAIPARGHRLHPQAVRQRVRVERASQRRRRAARRTGDTRIRCELRRPSSHMAASICSTLRSVRAAVTSRT